MGDRIINIAIVAFIIICAVSIAAMPINFRAEVIPKIDEMISECKTTNENRVSEINEVVWGHKHVYHDGSVMFPNEGLK